MRKCANDFPNRVRTLAPRSALRNWHCWTLLAGVLASLVFPRGNLLRRQILVSDRFRAKDHGGVFGVGDPVVGPSKREGQSGRTQRGQEPQNIARIVGEEAQLRVDVNGAWSAQQTLDWLQHNRLKNLVGIEQPVASNDLSGLKRLTKECALDIIVDESLRDLEDAKRLSDGAAVRFSTYAFRSAAVSIIRSR